MASRKEQKEAARQARIAQEQAAAARSAQVRRVGLIAGVVVVAVIIAVVAVVVSSSGSGSKQSGLATGATASKTYDAVATELAGIPQSGTTLGRASAPVTVEYFGDLECPICQEFTLGVNGGGLPQLISGPVKAGQVKVEYESFETATGGTNNDRWIPQQVAAYAAGKQDLFWDYAELFYREQESEETHYVTEAYLQGLAKQIPSLKFSAWMSARKDSSLAAQVKANGALAASDAIDSTPTLVAIGKHEELVPAASGIPTYAEIMTAVKAVS